MARRKGNALIIIAVLIIAGYFAMSTGMLNIDFGSLDINMSAPSTGSSGGGGGSSSTGGSSGGSSGGRPRCYSVGGSCYIGSMSCSYKDTGYGCGQDAGNFCCFDDAPDSDGDGVPNHMDSCPDKYGTLSNGCPDSRIR